MTKSVCFFLISCVLEGSFFHNAGIQLCFRFCLSFFFFLLKSVCQKSAFFLLLDSVPFYLKLRSNILRCVLFALPLSVRLNVSLLLSLLFPPTLFSVCYSSLSLSLVVLLSLSHFLSIYPPLSLLYERIKHFAN